MTKEISLHRGTVRLCWDQACLEGAIRLEYRRNGRRVSLVLDHPAEEQPWSDSASPHGCLEGAAHCQAEDVHGIALRLETAVHPDQPLLLWRLVMENHGATPVAVDQLDLFTGTLPGGDHAGRDLAFYSNGWQSWSRTAVYTVNDLQQRSVLGVLQNPMIWNASTPVPRRRGVFSSEFFGAVVDRQSRTGWLLGFLSQRQHFGTLVADLRHPARLHLFASGDGARLDPGQTIITDWAAACPISLDDLQPLDPYLQAAAVENEVHLPANPTLSGWCSWYHYFQKITAGDIRSNLQVAVRLKDVYPLDLVQIDDGFETQVGDWYTFRPGFPDGMAPLAEEIRREGFLPGIWLAPFIIDRRSRLAHEHPEYLLRNRAGTPVNAGFGWDRITTALDITRPDALEHAVGVVSTAAHEWGYPYLKLDFLYAAALPGIRHNPTLNRAQTLYRGMQAIRAAVGSETLLLGCGLPLGAGLGLVDAMRIGADVSPSWYPERGALSPLIREEHQYPSVRGALQNILLRAPQQGVWWINDPDCLMARPTTSLTEAELQSLASAIALCGGMTLVSDDMTALPPDRVRLVQQLLPPIGVRAALLDWADGFIPHLVRVDLAGAGGDWSLVGWFNFSDQPQTCPLDAATMRLPEGDYWLRSFWDGQVMLLPARAAWTPASLPPHGVRVMAVRSASRGAPLYLGGNFHFSQGMELVNWQPQPAGLSLRLALPRQAEGSFDLHLPQTPQTAFLNDAPLVWEKIQPGVYRFRGAFHHQADINIRWG